MFDSNIVVYFLLDGTRKLSYRGYTVNIKRRIRQHNGEISGGARYTRRSKTWSVVAYITGFTSKRTAMSYEWYTKRRRLTCHDDMMRFLKPHVKVQRFFAPLFAPKFEMMELRVHLASEYFDTAFTERLQQFYSIPSITRFSKLNELKN